MHGVGKGRKVGSRNKTAVERIVDTVVLAAGGNHRDTVKLLSEHWQTSQRRELKGQNPIRSEFSLGNKFADRYLKAMGMGNNEIKIVMASLVDMSKNPKTVSIIDD